MDNILQPANMVDFDFSNISLKNPKPIQGGSFLSSIKNNNKALIIQTPKIKTKKGITQTNKHIYTDLLFENEHNEFTDWVEGLQDIARNIILSKSESWFNDPVTLDEIEYNWNNSLRTYKQSKQLLRTFIHKNKGISSNILKIYDSDYKSKHINDITGDTSIICILEVIGLKFSSTNFQLDFCLRQVMILEDKPLFNEPLIKFDSKKVHEKKNGEKNVSFVEPTDEITLEKLDKTIDNLENDKQETQEIDNSNNSISSLKIENLEQVETTENKVDATNIIQQDEVDTINKDEPLEIKEIHKFNNQVNNELKKEVVEVGKVGEVEEINLDNLEKNDVFKKTEEEKDKLQEVNLTLDEKDSITLKKPNEIYLDIYRQAREKAKKAKQQAIKAYLEAKRIKELYMLEIVDSSEEDLDSESEDESEEDELFSEN
tara:strand:+ start:2055 stop:3344 length:1290 start_codon:yes stop_codon:yes gene_type:complete